MAEQCERSGKFCYDSHASANRSLGHMFTGRKADGRRRAISKSLSSYKCPFCDYWHLGRKRSAPIKRVCK